MTYVGHTNSLGAFCDTNLPEARRPRPLARSPGTVPPWRRQVRSWQTPARRARRPTQRARQRRGRTLRRRRRRRPTLSARSWSTSSWTTRLEELNCVGYHVSIHFLALVYPAGWFSLSLRPSRPGEELRLDPSRPPGRPRLEARQRAPVRALDSAAPSGRGAFAANLKNCVLLLVLLPLVCARVSPPVSMARSPTSDSLWAQANVKDVVEYLLYMKADVNIKNRDGRFAQDSHARGSFQI